ncbi:uncharacterized protein SPPG_01501 [Spizellomyces punctatus DAOM BR117]|uniref:Anoctamin dimerisation domain-containing protein n=1 Tax=Spizellomyces punctatus (strain DAOM BR117) TaxID=645134 RepID=A0A0L0HSK3_SPIPD|nr:uncharacterized protein SPPG_01501 [Spizellomyces punctatus DAOM BR117]KND04057.1 hypothetical protein SPPG_01501 [Spizellomyces punctatus DAOM BR117]|eukprot:XP_016612096.1 hypothetical protein SPPG_01501 [Spizellomyces punctatus DAOM BR117]
MVALRKPQTNSYEERGDNGDSFPFTATDWVIVFNTRINKKDTSSKTQLKGTQAAPSATPNVDHFYDGAKADVRKAWADVVSRLLAVGLKFRVQKWDEIRLAIFVYCPEKVLAREVYRSRVVDWLNDSGISELEPPALPNAESAEVSTPATTPAERLRLVHELLTAPTYEGGAGLTSDADVVGNTDAVGGKYIEAIYAPHDREFADKWVKSWAKRWLLSQQDIDAIRDYAGEKVAYYFAFLRFYLASLIAPALIGVLDYWWHGAFSPYYGVLTIVWSIIVISLWNRQAEWYATRWGTRNFSKIEKIRPEFRPTKIVIDPVTEERTPYYPYYKRWAVKCLITAPITIAITAVLTLVVLGIVSADVYFHKFYDGPGKDLMGFLPTILYGGCIPVFHSKYIKLAASLSDYENHPTDTQHAASFTQKLFTFNSLVAFIALFAESYLFIPLSNAIGSVLQQKGFISSMGFEVTPETLQARLIYLMITGQVLNAATELIVPLLTTKATTVMHGLHKSKAEKAKETEEERYVRRVRSEFERPGYDVDADYSEMVIQFGYIVLFSVAWPLAPLACLVNNFLELRADAFKICKANRRPVPQRADNIGPWLKNLTLFSWLSSLTAPSLSILYYKWVPDEQATNQVQQRLPTLLVALILSEHAYLLLHYLVSEATKALPSRGWERRKRAEFELKKRYLLRAGIDVLAGRHGGVVRWAGDQGSAGGEGVVMYGIALKGIHEVLGE